MAAYARIFGCAAYSPIESGGAVKPKFLLRLTGGAEIRGQQFQFMQVAAVHADLKLRIAADRAIVMYGRLMVVCGVRT